MKFIIQVNFNGISPYAITFLLSFIISFALAAYFMIIANVNRTLALCSTMLNFMLALYLAYIYTVITSESKDLRAGGFSSMGGMAGVLLGTLILGKLFKEYKTRMIKAYTVVLPLMYSISKIGCFLVGCCHGIEYHGIFSVTYTGADAVTTNTELLPIQLIETIVFFIIFKYAHYAVYMRGQYYYGIQKVICVCAASKFTLDYFRYSHINQILSPNQIACMIVAVIALITAFRKKKMRYENC